MARSLLLGLAVAVCGLLVVTDFADAGCRHRRRGGCGGYSHGCGGGGCGGYVDSGCGGCGQTYGGCGGGGCHEAIPYDGQPIPENGSVPPPPPSASIQGPSTTVTVATPTYRTSNVSYRRGLFGRFR